jgi:hypothetical protein
MNRTEKRKRNGFFAVLGLTAVLAVLLAFAAEGPQTTAFALTDSANILRNCKKINCNI